MPERKPNHPQGACHYVKFWGTRGTMPTPGPSTLRYGGNTACVEVGLLEKTGKWTSLVLDGGTGIIEYGRWALGQGQREFHIFLSHTHYDHIIGLTKFAPLFRKDCSITFYGQNKDKLTLEQIFQSFFTFPFFPITYNQLPSKTNLQFKAVSPDHTLAFGPAQLTFLALHHPQGAQAIRVQTKNGSAVYATDHEQGTTTDNELISFIKETDIFIFDSSFAEDTYKLGWGHSTASAGAHIAQKGKVKNYGLFHHEPESDDKRLESVILPSAQAIFPQSFLCKEGDIIYLGDTKSKEKKPPLGHS